MISWITFVFFTMQVLISGPQGQLKHTYADLHHTVVKQVLIDSCKSEIQFMSMAEQKNTLVSGNEGDEKNLYWAAAIFFN